MSCKSSMSENPWPTGWIFSQDLSPIAQWFSKARLKTEIKKKKKNYWNSFFSGFLFNSSVLIHKDSTWMSKKTPLCKSWPTAWIKVLSLLCQLGCFDRNIICHFHSDPYTALLNSCLHQLASFKNNNIQAQEHTAINSPLKYLILATTKGPWATEVGWCDLVIDAKLTQ